MANLNEFFPGELFDSLTAVIANNSDINFTGTTTGKNGGYYAVFEFDNGHKAHEFIGHTKAQLATFPIIGVYH
jgi:hypothetical protein